MDFSSLENTRKCSLCKDIKAPQAFVGEREVCRSCWLDLSEKDKTRYKLHTHAITLRKKRLAMKGGLFLKYPRKPIS